MPKLYEDLRETIVQEAKVLIVSNGYGKLNMREVAKASGIAVGTIYNYFPTKDSLMLVLNEQSSERNTIWHRKRILH